MAYLMRVNVRPDLNALSTGERDEMLRVFDIYAAEVRIHGEPVGWDEVEEVELVHAPTMGGLSAWILGFFVNTEERYHLGIYLRRDEAVLANLSKQQALYALQAVAFYAPKPVRYKGQSGFVPLVEL